MRPDIDRLLDDLRHTDRGHARLDELESLVLERIRTVEPASERTEYTAYLGVVAVLGAFAWGIVAGGAVAADNGMTHSGEILVEQIEFLAPTTHRPLS